MDQRLRAVDLLHICKKSKKSEIVKDMKKLECKLRVQCERTLCYRNKILRIIVISIMDVIFNITFSRKTSFCNMFLNQLNNMNNVVLLILFLCKKYNYNFTNFNNRRI